MLGRPLPTLVHSVSHPVAFYGGGPDRTKLTAAEAAGGASGTSSARRARRLAIFPKERGR
jgi:hypothetical protein